MVPKLTAHNLPLWFIASCFAAFACVGLWMMSTITGDMKNRADIVRAVNENTKAVHILSSRIELLIYGKSAKVNLTTRTMHNNLKEVSN